MYNLLWERLSHNPDWPAYWTCYAPKDDLEFLTLPGITGLGHHTWLGARNFEQGSAWFSRHTGSSHFSAIDTRWQNINQICLLLISLKPGKWDSGWTESAMASKFMCCVCTTLQEHRLPWTPFSLPRLNVWSLRGHSKSTKADEAYRTGKAACTQTEVLWPCKLGVNPGFNRIPGDGSMTNQQLGKD